MIPLKVSNSKEQRLAAHSLESLEKYSIARSAEVLQLRLNLDIHLQETAGGVTMCRGCVTCKLRLDAGCSDKERNSNGKHEFLCCKVLVVPFVFPNGVHLHNRQDQSGAQNASDDNRIDNLVALLIQTTRHHHHQILLPLRNRLHRFQPILLTKLDAWGKPSAVGLLPKLPLHGRHVVRLLQNSVRW